MRQPGILQLPNQLLPEASKLKAWGRLLRFVIQSVVSEWWTPKPCLGTSALQWNRGASDFSKLASNSGILVPINGNEDPFARTVLSRQIQGLLIRIRDSSGRL